MANLMTAYIGLGSNLGDRQANVKAAVEMLAETADVEVTGVSDAVETAPLGGADQPEYLNAVAQIRTGLDAEALHEKLHAVETALGRERKEKWSPRTIDLDLLLFGAQVINLAHLTVPHPQMHLRSFVLGGLCQLDERLMHPVMKESVRKLAARLNGCNFVLNPQAPQLVSVAGIIGVGKTTLTQKLAGLLGCKPIFEAYDKNPFLADVYGGRKELALDSQLFFLTSRVEQLNSDGLTGGQIAVSDYVFDKEMIYARCLLDARQLPLYEKVYRGFASKVSSPVLVIYLHDSPENCLERIHQRSRPYERLIKREFLEDLSCGYERLFADWRVCPLMRINMSEFDARPDKDVENLAKQIKYYTAE